VRYVACRRRRRWRPLARHAARCGAVALVALLREEGEEGEERYGIRLLADMRIVLADEEQMATSAILDKKPSLSCIRF
jgi:hypothetical protein